MSNFYKSKFRRGGRGKGKGEGEGEGEGGIGEGERGKGEGGYLSQFIVYSLANYRPHFSHIW